MFNIVLYTVFKIPRVFKIVSAISGSFLLLNYLNEVRLPLVTCLGCSMLFINKAVQATMKPHHTHLFGEILDLLKGLPSGERVHMPRLFQMKISLRGLCSFPERCSFRCFFWKTCVDRVGALNLCIKIHHLSHKRPLSLGLKKIPVLAGGKDERQ